MDSSRRRRAGGGRAALPATASARGPAAALPLRHPALLAAAALAAACILVSVTFRIYDFDIWQHLLVGKVIWVTHSIPTRQIWTWPTYGTPDVNPSLLFRAMLWPFWDVGGVWGLYLWRWLTTVAAFGIAWATARHIGARGAAALVALVACALVYRQRSQVRPETLAVVLLALQIWLLESRRRGGVDRWPWLVGIAWAWVNTHISFLLGFVVLAVHLLDAHVAAWRARRAAADAEAAGQSLRRLWLVVLACLAISFVNPFGARALWRPFEYLLYWRNDPLFLVIGELRPIEWSVNWRNGLPLLMIGWPALQLWRARRSGLDRVEGLLCLAVTGWALSSARFLSFFAVAAAPYVARDLDAWVASRRWPEWSAPPWRRAALASTACVLLGLAEWTRSDFPLGVALDWKYYPVRACDFMKATGVRGRGYNTFNFGGYQLYRFWPERDRLPFIDIHPEEATPEKRRLYVLASQEQQAWVELQDRYRIDYALLARLTFKRDRLPDFLDADPRWALVFMDDAAALFVRRDGSLRAIADRHAYRLLPAGNLRLGQLGEACRRDPALRARFAAELERQVRESPYNATALSLHANLAILDGRLTAALDDLRRAVAADPEDRGLRARVRAVERKLGQ